MSTGSDRSSALSLSLGIVASLCVAGCAAQVTAPVQPGAQERRVPMTLSATEKHVRQSLNGLGFEIYRTYRGPPRTIRTAARPVAVTEFCECGKYGSLVIFGQAQSSLFISLEPSSTGDTVVQIENDCSMLYRQERIQCATTGVIEQDFWNQLACSPGETECEAPAD